MEAEIIRELSPEEVDVVSGGELDASSAGLAIIGLGIAGGPVTGLFGLFIGGLLLYLDNCA